MRLTAGRSCPFLKLGAGEASPAPPGRGLCPLPSPPEGGSAPRLPRRGGSIPPTPLLRAGCVTARDKPPSCLRQGRGLHPKQAAFLRAARAESTILQLDGNTRTRGNDTHARALASGPKRDAKFFAKLSSKKAGGGRGVLQGQGHQEKSSQGPAGQVGHHGAPHGPAPPALLQQQGKYSHFH